MPTLIVFNITATSVFYCFATPDPNVVTKKDYYKIIVCNKLLGLLLLGLGLSQGSFYMQTGTIIIKKHYVRSADTKKTVTEYIDYRLYDSKVWNYRNNWKLRVKKKSLMKKIRRTTTWTHQKQ